MDFSRVFLTIFLYSTKFFLQDMKNIKNSYQQMLDSMVGIYDEKKEWIQVKMIDFAHAFNNSELSDGQATGVDHNYINAIEHLVQIFEEFLKQCE